MTEAPKRQHSIASVRFALLLTLRSISLSRSHLRSFDGWCFQNTAFYVFEKQQNRNWKWMQQKREENENAREGQKKKTKMNRNRAKWTTWNKIVSYAIQTGATNSYEVGLFSHAIHSFALCLDTQTHTHFFSPLVRFSPLQLKMERKFGQICNLALAV